MQAVWTQWLFC